MNSHKKVLHISTIDVGGAYNATKRLNEMMLRNNIDSKVMVRTKLHNNSLTVSAFGSKTQEYLSKVKNAVNLLCKKGEVKRDIIGTNLCNHKMVREADVIFIHWISTFLSPREIYKLSKLEGKRIIFVMHDMWLFTGGCHVDRRCGGYVSECARCPMAGRKATKSYRWKKRYINKADIEVIGPSHWIVDEANKSSILDGKLAVYIPNVFDAEVFYPRNDVPKLKEKYGVSQSKKILMFGAADAGTANINKGFNYLCDALGLLDATDIQLLVIGNANGAKEALSNYDTLYMGYINDEDILADLYSIADAYINPSLQESFGYTVCEAMACGTPVVAFAVGGMLDQIIHKENGYLAEFCSSEDLAAGIEYTLNNCGKLSKNALCGAKRFSYESAWLQYREYLYSK